MRTSIYSLQNRHAKSVLFLAMLLLFVPGQFCQGPPSSNGDNNSDANQSIIPEVCTTADGAAADLATDPANCGTCGNVCPAVPNATAVCNNGQCGFTCNPGFADCDNDPANGCEAAADLATDAANCGTCGNVCPAVPNATAVCDNGQCGFLCNPGSTDCDGDPSNGCERGGLCFHCTTAADCPGADTECQSRVCNAGVCDMLNAPAGTPTSLQSPGDCKQNQCDGMGNVVAANCDTDTADGGNQCATEVCTNGVPSSAPKPAGTPCNQNGGSFCDGSGACIGCATASDCPAGNGCQIAACNAGVCSLINAPANSPSSQQMSGDCHQNVCDGAGHVTTVIDDTDPPTWNECLMASCQNGTPTFIAMPAMPCFENGNPGMCDSDGHCVPW